MWERVGIIRDRAGLESATRELAALRSELHACGSADGNRAFHPTWHDCMNLESLIDVSEVIARAALAREDSRGAHFRSDFPAAGPLEQSAFTTARAHGGAIEIGMKPVTFTLVRPGQTLLKEAA
jgi:fumarate reductase flavoprotein subunit